MGWGVVLSEDLYRHPYGCKASAECLCQSLFTMTEFDAYTILLMQMFCNMLSTIDAAMLASGTAKGYHQMGETSVDESFCMEIDKRIYALEESQDFAVFLKEIDDRLVKSCQALVLFVTSWIVCASAVEHIASAVAGVVLWDSFLERE